VEQMGVDSLNFFTLLLGLTRQVAISPVCAYVYDSCL